VGKVHFEYLGEGHLFPGSKVWKVEAIHVTTTSNKRMFTQAELESAGRSLSFRPININHDRKQLLPFPENQTLAMNFNRVSMAVEGSFSVSDPAINAMIETGRIRQVSIEQIPTAGESCNELRCEQHGVAFIGMALLESDVPPGDPNANIKIESLMVSDEQRTCTDCTDFIACEKCRHKSEDCVSDSISEIKAAHPDWERDQVIATALSKCGKSKPEEARAWYEYVLPKYESIKKTTVLQ